MAAELFTLHGESHPFEVDRDLLILAPGHRSLMAVDLVSGALVRAHSPVDLPGDWLPFDVVGSTVLLGTQPADPAAPESIEMLDEPDHLGHMDWWSAEPLLRPLLHPRGSAILGFTGASALYWSLEGTRPTIGILDTQPHLVAGPHGLACRFLWHGLVHELPITDRRLPPWQPALGRQELADYLGHPARRILVALTPPHEGHCYKVVAGILPG